MEDYAQKKPSKDSSHYSILIPLEGGVLGISVGVVTLLIIIFTLNYFNVLSLSQFFPSLFGKLPHKTSPQSNLQNQPGITTTSTSPNAIIAKVGNENIYQKDLDYELKYFPPVKNYDVKKILLTKMAQDSAILQGAKDAGLVTLTDDVYNSVNKDYELRLKTISDLKKKIQEQQAQITGKVVSIWFYNDAVGKMGLEKSKELARSKITTLHDQVKSGKMTIDQAAETIKQDTSLAQIDPSFQSNALLSFTAIPGKAITIDQRFDTILRNTKKGEITDVFLAKATPASLRKLTDAYFEFGQVTDKTQESTIPSYEEWLKQQTQKYALSQ